ncbi:MAG: T9SS type A sorting domain-containing protein [Chloroflexi bacterium]|nr:T9SS type A sorting domain-containing protein [Chloroflexota bacterium]
MATDEHGNRSNYSFPIEVKDTAPPAVVINKPVNGQTFQSNHQIDVDHVVTDKCCAPASVDVAVLPSDPFGPPLPVGAQVITVKATDASGNKGSASVIVNVIPIPAAFDFDPDNLNIAHSNGLASGYIELRQEDGAYDQIDLSTVRLKAPRGTIQPITDPKFGYVKSPSSYGVDENRNGVLERLAKFYKADVVNIVEAPTSILTITGNLLASSPFGAAAFEGSYEVSVTGSSATAQTQEKAGRGKPVVLLPDSYALFPNAPNPFNASTQITYQLPEAGEVYLAVYNLMGQMVRVLVQEHQGAGYYQAEWDGQDEYGQPVSSGVYLYRFVSAELAQTRRMLLVK